MTYCEHCGKLEKEEVTKNIRDLNNGFKAMLKLDDLIGASIGALNSYKGNPEVIEAFREVGYGPRNFVEEFMKINKNIQKLRNAYMKAVSKLERSGYKG